MSIINKYKDNVSENKAIIWCEHNLVIEGKKIKFDKNQKELLRSKSKKRIVVSKRRMGKTESIIIDALYNAIKEPGVKVGIYTTHRSQEREVISRIKEMFKESFNKYNLLSSQRENEFALLNGSKIEVCNAMGRDSGRGVRYDYLYLDEAAHMNNTSISNLVMASIRGNVLAVSTLPTSLKEEHWFYKTYHSDNDYSKFLWSAEAYEDFNKNTKTMSNSFEREYLRLFV